jgi:hypothetical protein
MLGDCAWFNASVQHLQHSAKGQLTTGALVILLDWRMLSKATTLTGRSLEHRNMHATLRHVSNLSIQKLICMGNFATWSLPNLIGFGESRITGIAPCRGRLDTEHSRRIRLRKSEKRSRLIKVTVT